MFVVFRFLFRGLEERGREGKETGPFMGVVYFGCFQVCHQGVDQS